MAEKYALCVSRNELNEIPRFSEKLKFGVQWYEQATFDLPELKTLSLRPRSICETDPDWLQIIPYVTLIDPDGRVFHYSRGGSGGEDRLYGKVSLGLGGHVDFNVSTTFEDLLISESIREIKEEVGITLDPSDIRVEGFVYEWTPDGNDVPVGAVHFGIHMVARAKNSSLGELEAGIITHGSWVDVEDFPEYTDQYEKWSYMIGSLLWKNDVVCNMDTVEIDGIEYHARRGDNFSLDPITDDYGAIPADQCLCAAHCSSECACGAWDRP